MVEVSAEQLEVTKEILDGFSEEDLKQASPEMLNYFKGLKKEVDLCYKIANSARSKGYDPDMQVEIPLTSNISERVEGLISTVMPQVLNSGISERIQELEKEYGSLNWRVGCQIGLEVAQQKFCTFKDEKESMETGVRIALAYLTLGVISAPLEGFIGLEIKKRKDGKNYVATCYAGPIRASGGTASAVSVIFVDYIRKNMGYAEYDPTPEEVKRNVTELADYHERITNLQYNPSAEEKEHILSNIAVEVTGDPTEVIEVSNYKDLDRIPTNHIRGGMCLVVAEGIALKAPKIYKQFRKWGKDFGIYWEWMDEFMKLQERIKAKSKTDDKEEEEEKPKIMPNYTFIKDVVAGRPVYGFPLTSGAFRLRYGRARTSGFAAQALHPATMAILNDSVSTGTQMKVEMPGKANVCSPVDSVEGPRVLLQNGDFLFLENETDAREASSQIKEITYIGDLLINYGDFSENGHILAPPGYCEEWWFLELKKSYMEKHSCETFNLEEINVPDLAHTIGIEEEILAKLFLDPKRYKIDFISSYLICKYFEIPMHPRFVFFYNEITKDQLKKLVDWFMLARVDLLDSHKELLSSFDHINTSAEALHKLTNETSSMNIDFLKSPLSKIILPFKKDEKRILELLGIPHKVSLDYIIIEKLFATAVYVSFGKFDFSKFSSLNELSDDARISDFISEISLLPIKDKSGTFIGTRMGRPEKAKMRKLQGSPHGLFPVGKEGGRMKSFQSALEAKKVTSEFKLYHCTHCDKESVYHACEDCGNITEPRFFSKDLGLLTTTDNLREDVKRWVRPFSYRAIDVNFYFEKAMEKINESVYPDLIKGIDKTINKERTVEHLAKAILRAKHDIYVNKDGTIRYDMIEMPITHFKPYEIEVSVSRLRELGYLKDIYDKPLERDDQILELKCQDILLPCCDDSPDENCDLVVLRITKFIDELLVKLYGEEPYYNCNTRDDLVGQLVIAMAPHTSAGIVGRILGFTKTQGMYCHPMMHAAMRRNCDGDEATILMLFDGLLNFSPHYLPDRRGSRTMDAPLVLTYKLIPGEVDDEVHGMDVMGEYPLEFYDIALKCGAPWEIKFDQIGGRLNTPGQYEGMKFTHDTTNINAGVLCSSYKTLPSMKDKLFSQMDIAEKLRGVPENKVAQLVIERHFIPDLKGNLRQFYKQTFRCTNCNEIYRRPPLRGRCIKCNKGNLVFTVSKGAIIKYLEPSLDMANKYHLPSYLIQTLEIIKVRIETALGRDVDRQEGLDKWF